MNIQQLFRVFLLVGFFTSCTIEDEITDLTLHEDYLIETTVIFEDGSENYHIPVTYYKTDSYNNLAQKNVTYDGSIRDNRQVFIEAVKRYKKAGLRIQPQENVKEVYIYMYRLGIGKEIYHYFQAEGNRTFTYMYDFETYSHEVTWE